MSNEITQEERERIIKLLKDNLRAAGIDIPEETCHLVCIEQNAFRTLLQCDNCFQVIIGKSSNASINYDR